ncbi:MAG: peptidase domain-containing ABC transporter [Cyanobacteriota bacterium]
MAPLSPEAQHAIAAELVWQRYDIGQPLLQADRLPHAVHLIQQSRVRVVGNDPQQGAFSLALLGPGEAVGWASLLRASPCETVIAAEPALVAALPAERFLALLKRWPELELSCGHVGIAELAAVLLPWWQAHPRAMPQRRQRLQSLEAGQAVALGLGERPSGPATLLWLASGGPGPLGQRWLGVPHQLLEPPLQAAPLAEAVPIAAPLPDPIPPESLGLPPRDAPPPTAGLQLPNGRAPHSGIDSAAACVQWLGQHLGHPVPLEVVRQALRLEPDEQPGLLAVGLLLENLGLQVRPLLCPSRQFHQLEAPALLRHHDQFLLLEHVSARGWQLIGSDQQREQLSLVDLRQRWPDGVELLQVRRDGEPSEPNPAPPSPSSSDAGGASPRLQFDLLWFWTNLRPYRPRLAVLLGTGLVSKLLELVFPLAILQIVDMVVVSRNGSLLWPIGLVLGSTALVMGILGILRQLLLADLADRIDTGLGSQVVGHLFRLPLRFFDRRTVGDLASRLHDLQRVREFLTDTAINTVLDVIFLPVLLIVLYSLQPVLATVVLLQVPLLILLSGGSTRLGERLLVRRNRAWSRSQSLLVEVLTAIRTVKSQNFAAQARWQWLERYRQFTDEDYRLTRLRTLVRESGGAVVNGFKVALFVIAAALALEGRTSIGAIFAVYLLSSGVTGPLVNLARLNDQYRDARSAMDALADVLGQPPEEPGLSQGFTAIPLPPIRGAIRFEQVRFAYRLDSRPLLDNLNLSITPGSFVGLVGLSGSGKSTVVQLLDGLYKADSGRVFIDDVDISRVQLSSLRRQVGFVPQESILFDGTVLDNLCLNCPDAPFEQVQEACRIACADAFIETLPNGYHSRVGERGGGLSGGQKQRIAIARMLLQNPRLVILDEATSALDADTERRLVRQLRAHLQGRTLLFVTHRLGNLRQADRILVMDDGQVVEDGTWQGLVAQGGSFAVLANQQHELNGRGPERPAARPLA